MSEAETTSHQITLLHKDNQRLHQELEDKQGNVAALSSELGVCHTLIACLMSEVQLLQLVLVRRQVSLLSTDQDGTGFHELDF